MAALGPSVAHYLSHALAPSTLSTYRSDWSSYRQFCCQHGLHLIPPTDTVLSRYASHLADRRVTHGTIHVYLSAIAFHSQLQGHRIDYNSMPTLHYVMLGIRRLQGSSLLRPPREPVTPRLMLQLRTYLLHALPAHDGLMVWAAFSSAFFGLLRSSEYCCPTSSTISSASLLRHHLSFSADRSSAKLFLPRSKTDQSARGADISFFTLPSPLCPVSALWHFARVRHAPTASPLFILDNGDFLTCEFTVGILLSAFPSTPNINTHSFRIGGASALADAGVPDYVIQILGRWSSDSFLRYIRTPPESLRAFQHTMLDHHSG